MKHGSRPSEVNNNQLRAIIEAYPFTTTAEIAQKVNTDHFTVIWHLKQIGKVRNLNKWVPHELTKNQKNFHLKCFLLLFYATAMNHFLMDCHMMKNGFYTTTDD